MKIVTISDTHNAHSKLTIPDCDILIHAGDESFRGRRDEIEAFVKWFDIQPAKHLVWIPGNHSLGVEAHWPGSANWIKDISPRTNILMNSDVTLEGLKIWGSPVTPWFCDWAWNVQRGADIKKYWDKIPSDASIVVTHGPPHGILDVVEPNSHSAYPRHAGCEELMKAMVRVKPKLHVFGHIHEGYGVHVTPDTTYVNASIMDVGYDPVNLPLEFNL
jgi:Icc-related predicted phosphoesterase